MSAEVLSMEITISKLPEGRLRRKYETICDELGPDVHFIKLYGRILWFVPGQTQASIIQRLGYRRSAIWTLSEVQDFMEACGSPVSTLEEAARLLASECPTEGTSQGLHGI